MQRRAPQPTTSWPAIPDLDAWLDTFETFHRWTQIVGKIRLQSTPWINHAWHSPLYVTPRGLTTSTMYRDGRAFEIAFDLLDDRLEFTVDDGRRESFDLEPMAVSDFYAQTMDRLATLGLGVEINPMPVEIPDPIEPLDEDRTHDAYDREPVVAFWRGLLQAHRIFTRFRARFSGKASPVLFFWGSFDLAASRFSGRPAPEHPGGIPNLADWIVREAYSHEVSSAGFWPGHGLGEAAFFSYGYPEPEGFRDYPVGPDAAFYSDDLREFILPYAAVRDADDPDAALLEFLQTTYDAEAELADWDRDALEFDGAPSET